MVIYFCSTCDPTAKNAIKGHKLCPNCKRMLHYCCKSTGRVGLYTHFSRHAKKCSFCHLTSREQEKRKKEDLAEQARQLASEEHRQEPYASWVLEEGKIKQETGLDPQPFDLLFRSVDSKLADLHGTQKHYHGKLLISTHNLLLLYLVFLRKTPPREWLNSLFHCTASHLLVRRIANVVEPVLAQYVVPPPRHSRVIQQGQLAGAAFLVDTSTTKIPRPGRGQGEERKLYYYGKAREWAIKWQLTVGLDGKIWDNHFAEAASKSDRAMFEESVLPI